jgi:hypothetical protein
MSYDILRGLVWHLSTKSYILARQVPKMDPSEASEITIIWIHDQRETFDLVAKLFSIVVTF